MKKSDILKELSKSFPEITKKELSEILDGTFEAMIKALSDGDRIEIRGFGSFKVKEKPARVARNPKTGEKVEIDRKKTVHFKTGKILKKELFSKEIGN